MESILAYGDSNTWGLIPGSGSWERYSSDIRWTGILQKKMSKHRIIEDGLCGRTTIFEDQTRTGRNGLKTLTGMMKTLHDVDGAILMLGTNDCKKAYRATAYEIGNGIEKHLDILEQYVHKERILLISPIELGEDVWKPEKDPDFDKKSVKTSKELKTVYMNIAQKRGIHFLAASDYASANEKDYEHLGVDGHLILANVVYKELREMNLY